ncbi:hypothetical protein H6P81_001071 [Aristolochia fimbriata]|uniref:Saposin B-type domain-containing protein n=1 Tax=Aristolochia fimbriata TaxID=158543 RepID=A0AAV7F663_ARIFI|nr:hypothetical protein H6P81_001071 [Aristolochia fimbriata]
MARSEAVLLISLVFLASLGISDAAKKAVPTARKEDVPYIKCQVCEKLTAQLLQQVQKKESQIFPKKVSEFQIIEIAENVCNLKKEEGDWIFQIDIAENGDALELVEQGTEGECNSECKTIERACQEVLGYSDTDVAEFLFNKKPDMGSLFKFLCKDLTMACSTKPPPLPKGRVPGESFQPKSSKEAEMEKILRSMQGIPGAPSMKMYSKEDILNNNLENEEGDDDEEEDSFPSNLGKVLKDKQSLKTDWKQRILKGFRETVSSTSLRINKASRRLQDWWKGKKTTSKLSKAKKPEL